MQQYYNRKCFQRFSVYMNHHNPITNANLDKKCEKKVKTSGEEKDQDSLKGKTPPSTFFKQKYRL